MIKNNPLDLEIGQEVTVKAKAFIEYDSRNYRHIKRAVLNKKRIVYVLRTVRRAEGIYNKPFYSGGMDGYDYEPATFTAKKYMLLYEVTESISSKPFLVFPEDIEQ